MPSLSQYSEPALDPMLFAVWCYVVAWLLIIIICIECPPRFVRLWTIWCNKCDISLLGLVFCITIKSSSMRGRFTSHSCLCLYSKVNNTVGCWLQKFLEPISQLARVVVSLHHYDPLVSLTRFFLFLCRNWLQAYTPFISSLPRLNI